MFSLTFIVSSESSHSVESYTVYYTPDIDKHVRKKYQRKYNVLYFLWFYVEKVERIHFKVNRIKNLYNGVKVANKKAAIKD